MPYFYVLLHWQLTVRVINPRRYLALRDLVTVIRSYVLDATAIIPDDGPQAVRTEKQNEARLIMILACCVYRSRHRHCPLIPASIHASDDGQASPSPPPPTSASPRG